MLQLTKYIGNLIHKDQAGFVPGRSIFNHIHLTKLMISYAEIMEDDGVILALDQEKAYDKNLRHDQRGTEQPLPRNA
ncbi:hypothetical protein BC834DRAFT_1026394, partial [Gloeopeniophorella convolvens]